ncbi:hypothetical protein BKH42_03480 [Helicobacter sp. 13S00482-2]|uniref:hypothetical protein n=1 Tax=Helicobacter sp. 13S00482-2 TaxID=1476200 RepID=UPI000BA5332C|nr:hypothetical protein [Helicobacter sp. 13S00482-2]PAF53802.1 hypothetical protein BKH42_03480 [Helicobacter sp. 13S00482-2]
MRNDYTMKQLRFYGLSKTLIDNIGKNSSNIISDIINESIKNGTLHNILIKYFQKDEINSIIEELDKSLSLSKNNKKMKTREEVSTEISNQAEEALEIESKGFNI